MKIAGRGKRGFAVVVSAGRFTHPDRLPVDSSVNASKASATTGVKAMLKVNTNSMVELSWSSPKGKFAGAGKEVSEALGRKPLSTDLKERHPFDVELDYYDGEERNRLSTVERQATSC